MKPFIILGKWYPSLEELDRGYGPFDYGGAWDYRPPVENRQVVRRNVVTEWHQDDWGVSEALILWVDVYPTEIKLPNENIVSGEPNDVVLIANKTALHRTPVDYVAAVELLNDANRHFVRATLPYYPSIDTIKKWKNHLRAN